MVDGRVTQVGVSSFAPSNCASDVKYIQGFAKVSSMKSWIFSNSDAANYQCGYPIGMTGLATIPLSQRK